jgi:hypothetical protein
MRWHSSFVLHAKQLQTLWLRRVVMVTMLPLALLGVCLSPSVALCPAFVTGALREPMTSSGLVGISISFAILAFMTFQTARNLRTIWLASRCVSVEHALCCIGSVSWALALVFLCFMNAK